MEWTLQCLICGFEHEDKKTMRKHIAEHQKEGKCQYGGSRLSKVPKSKYYKIKRKR